MDKKTSIIILVILAVLGTAYHFLWSGNDGPEAEPQGLVEPDPAGGVDAMSRLEIPYRLEDSESEII